MQKKKNIVRLGVNIDHIATLRQVRGGTTDYPDLVKFASMVLKAGADQLTIHLREDRRHIQEKDLVNLSKKWRSKINLEMAATDEMKNFALKYRPHIICLVPEKREELTTEGGLDILSKENYYMKFLKPIKEKKILVSTFIEPSVEQVESSFRIGATAVEFHTGHWVLYKGEKKKKIWKRLKECALLAHSKGLQVHAGHGLDFNSTSKILKLPHLEEVNIGHFLVCDALNGGISKSVRNMKKILKGQILSIL